MLIDNILDQLMETEVTLEGLGTGNLVNNFQLRSGDLDYFFEPENITSISFGDVITLKFGKKD